MTFRKYASVVSCGTATFDHLSGSLMRKTARAVTEKDSEVVIGTPHTASVYLDGAKKIDVQSVLAKAAAKYKLSTAPSDYLYEAVRACTATAPNENGDAFPRDELLRYDLKRGAAVYLSFREKPHHLNHLTTDPTEARGILLDAHYHDGAPALEHCPACNTRTAERENRDASGLLCKCGTVVKDEFVECLIAIDAKKDPPYARAVEAGTLNATSMGCDCEETSCLVCGHVARSASQFCAHIKGSGKRAFYVHEMTPEGANWKKTDPITVERELKRRGMKFIKAGFRTARAKDGYEVRRGVEDCHGVEFQEQSRVAHPADPRALQRAIIRTQQRMASAQTDTERESMRTVVRRLEAQLTQLKAQVVDTGATDEGTEEQHKFVLVRINGDDSDTHAAETVEKALDLALPGEMDEVEMAEVEAPDAGAARLMPAQGGVAQWQSIEPSDHGYGAHMGQDADVSMSIPDGMQITLVDAHGQPINPNEMPGAPGTPGALTAPGMPGDPNLQPTDEPAGEPGGIQEVTDDMTKPKDQQITPAEMGILPPPASGDRPFRAAYDKLFVDAFEDGSLAVGDYRFSEEPLFTTAGVKSSDKVQLQAAAQKLYSEVHANGLVATMMTRGAQATRKLAQISEGAVMPIEMPADAPKTVQDNAESPSPKMVAPGPTKSMAEGAEKSTDTGDDKVPDGVLDGGASTSGIKHSPADGDASVAEGAELAAPLEGDTGKEMPSEGVQESGQSPLSSSAALEARFKKIYAARLEKVRTDAALEIAAVKKTAAEAIAAERAVLERRFARGLKLAASRRRLNLEPSPMKIAMHETLINSREVGTDAAGRPLEYAPMSESLAAHLVEAAFHAGHDEEVETLVTRAAELLAYDDTYFASAEADLRKQAAVLPQVEQEEALAPRTASAEAAASTRREVRAGNLPVAPTPYAEGVDSDESPIREALSSTRLSQRLARRKQASGQRI